MLNLINQGLALQAQAVNNVVQFPTHEQVEAIKAQGKRVVHRPDHAERNAEQVKLLQQAIDGDFGPEAA